MKKPIGKESAKPKSEETAIAGHENIHDEDMLDDYSFLDWSKAERGKYAKRQAEEIRIVVISHDDDQNQPD